MKIPQLKGWNWLGSLINTYGQAAMMLSAINLAFTGGTFYIVGILPWMNNHGLNLPSWLTLAILVLLVLSFLWFAYAVVLPSYYIFMKTQYQKYGDFTAPGIQTILKRLDDIEASYLKKDLKKEVIDSGVKKG